MSRLGLHPNTVVVLAAAIASALLVALLVLRSSEAAFSAHASDEGNEWSSGSITLSHNNSTASAMFHLGDGVMGPGEERSRCIQVEYDGTLPDDYAVAVTLYAENPVGDVLDYLDLEVQVGTSTDPDEYGTCTTFVADGAPLVSGTTVADFAATSSSFLTGAGPWEPAGSPEVRTYKFTVTLQDDDAAQGRTGKVDFTWEAQSAAV